MRQAGGTPWGLMAALIAAPTLAAQADPAVTPCVIEGGAAPRLMAPAPVPELEARVAADTNDAQAHFQLALGYWTEQRYADVERSLRTVLAIEPRFPVAMLALSQLPFACNPRLRFQDPNRLPPPWRQRLEESRDLERRAFLLDPLVDLSIIGAVLPVLELRILGNSREARRVREMFAAIQDVTDGRYGEGYDRLGGLIRALEADRRSGGPPEVLYWYRGLAAGHLEKWDLAIADIGRLLDRAEAPADTTAVPMAFTQVNEFRYLLAVLQHRAGRLDEAVRLYHACLEQDLGLYPAHVQLARIYQARREWDLALLERRRALEASPDDPDLLLEYGVTLFRAGHGAEAEEPLAQVAAARPRNYHAEYYLGAIAAAANDTGAARRHFLRFLALAPRRLTERIAEVTGLLAGLPEP